VEFPEKIITPKVAFCYTLLKGIKIDRQCEVEKKAVT